MVFLWWCFSGGVVVVFLWWCCGGVFVVVLLYVFFCEGSTFVALPRSDAKSDDNTGVKRCVV